MDISTYTDIGISFENSNARLYYKFNEQTEAIELVKIWQRSPEVDETLIHELWSYELRLLNKLKMVKDANNYLLISQESRVDNNSYSIIYNLEENHLILSQYLESENKFQKYPYLDKSKLRFTTYRIIFWRNILRVAKGLNILHQQNLIHSNIIIRNILLKDNENDENFVLTGFEYCLSLADFKGSTTRVGTSSKSSYIQDWIQVGELCESFLCSPETKMELVPNELSILSEMLNSEKLLLNSNGINGDHVIGGIEEIISILSGLEDQQGGKEYQLFFAKNFLDKRLTEQARSLAEKDGQSNLLLEDILNFINDDLKINNITLIYAKNNKEDKYFIKGKKYIYEVIQYKENKTFGSLEPEHNWSRATCFNIFDTLPHWAKFSKKLMSYQMTIKLVTAQTVSRRYAQLDNNITYKEWSHFEILKKQTNIDPLVKDFLQSIAICHAIEVAEYKINIFEIHTAISENKIIVELNVNSKLAKLLKLIGIKLSVLDHFRNLLSEYSSSKWLLSKSELKKLSDFKAYDNLFALDFKDEDLRIELNYISYDKGKFYFNLESHLNTGELIRYIDKSSFYLTPIALAGSIASLMRKNKAYMAISNNYYLIKSLMAPDEMIVKSNFEYPYIDSYEDMDESKQDVFTDILQTHPNYVVQGPPGVGKTFLVTAIIEQIFKDEPNSKIVLTAQSHTAIQVLYDAINNHEVVLPPHIISIDDFKNEIRLDDDTSKIDKYTGQYLENLKSSALWKNAYKKYSDINDDMNQFILSTERRKPFYRQVVSAANILYTTTNSAIVEELVKNNAQFDWTIIEEAGKVSGNELVSPLLLSHRRLMIGDQKQLPPFAEKVVTSILERNDIDYSLLIDGITTGVFKTNLVKMTELDNFSDLMQTPNLDVETSNLLRKRLDGMFENSKRHFSLFKHIVEISSRLRESDSPSMGDILKIQYRMHPNISSLISELFYGNDLKNDKKTETHYLDQSKKPFSFIDTDDFPSINSSKGIVWLGIQDSNKHGFVPQEKNYTNKFEAKIITRALELLRSKRNLISSSEKPLKLMVLSPYKNQVDILNNIFSNNNIIEKLQENGFCVAQGENLCKTVDSFQGGEADLIILSLVRHNGNPTIKSALGFLLDERRMNVMLSRAKYQMIVVGSLELLDYWTKLSSGNGDDDFLSRVVNMLKPDVNRSDELTICDYIPIDFQQYSSLLLNLS